jgi:hypothetical protein
MFVLNPCNRPCNSDIGGPTDALTFLARHKPFCSMELAVGRSQGSSVTEANNEFFPDGSRGCRMMAVPRLWDKGFESHRLGGSRLFPSSPAHTR